jgi:GDPmannose 4,6-dehydratase
VSNGILFNHESPLRGVGFVTRKTSLAVAGIANSGPNPSGVWQFECRTGLGHARDFVEGMWRMLQQEMPDDYVLARRRLFGLSVMRPSRQRGLVLAWEGRGIHAIGRDVATGETLVCVNPAYFLPAEVERLCGDRSKTIAKLGGRPRTSVWELAAEMVSHDIGAVDATGSRAKGRVA